MRGFVSAKDAYVDIPGDNRREFDRIDYRTVGTAYAMADGPDKPEMLIRVWTRDVSISGAKLSSNSDISGRRLYLKLLLPQFKDCVIECEVVRQYKQVRESLTKQERVEFLYGVRFIDLHKRDALPANVLEALDQGPAS